MKFCLNLIYQIINLDLYSQQTMNTQIRFDPDLVISKIQNCLGNNHKNLNLNSSQPIADQNIGLYKRSSMPITPQKQSNKIQFPTQFQKSEYTFRHQGIGTEKKEFKNFVGYDHSKSNIPSGSLKKQYVESQRKTSGIIKNLQNKQNKYVSNLGYSVGKEPQISKNYYQSNKKQIRNPLQDLSQQGSYFSQKQREKRYELPQEINIRNKDADQAISTPVKNINQRRQFLKQAQEKLTNFSQKIQTARKNTIQVKDSVINESKKYQSRKGIQTRHNKCASIGIYNHSKNIQFSNQNLSELDHIRQKYLNEYEKSSTNTTSINPNKRNSQINQQSIHKNYGRLRQKYSSLSQATRNTVSKSMYLEDPLILNSNAQKNYEQSSRKNEKSINKKIENDFNAYTFHNTQSNQQSEEEYNNRISSLNQNTKKCNDSKAYESLRQQKSYEPSSSYLDSISIGNYGYSKISSSEQDRTEKTMSKLKKINQLNEKINDRIRKIISNFETK